MIFPAVGLNEWGRTFWFMEELFVEPLHWMFVFFGWFSLAVFGVTLQLLGRVVELAHGHEELVGLEPNGGGDSGAGPHGTGDGRDGDAYAYAGTHGSGGGRPPPS
jgi:Ammonia monooxygenase/methane monooxygenase, subunit C